MRSTTLLLRTPVLTCTSSTASFSSRRLLRLLRLPAAAQRCSFCSSSIVRSTASADPATWNIAKVPHRGVLEASGRDTVKLIQGLVSNDVKPLDPTKTSSNLDSPALLYAGFMNPQGRMLADAFIHRQPALEDGSPRWLLDVDSRTLPSLLAFIKKFKLRSKVKLTDVSAQHQVVQVWHSSASSQPSQAISEKLALDPRCPAIGYRGVLSSDSDLTLGGVNVVEGEEYTLHRILNGIGEGSLDFPVGSSLPLENNLDYMNGVDFRKGCYVGQELTARTHHTGVVRKRLLPLTFYPAGSPAPTSLSLASVDRSGSIQLPNHLTEVRSKPVSSGEAKQARGKAAGKFTSGVYNVGLGCLRLEQVQRWSETGREDGLEMSIKAADGETTLMVRPWIPNWWPKKLVPSDGEE